jgi:hypothetical protein
VALSGPASRALLALAVITLGCALARTPAARGDADPASDMLLVQDAFYPYGTPAPASLRRSLQTELEEIARTGLALKVAVVAGPVDLGGVPQLYGRPARYARFLDAEISTRGPQPLLVVMGDGLATQHAGPARAVAGLRPSGGGSAALVQTALTAVQRVAAARGRPIAPVTAPQAASSFSGAAVAGAAAIALLVVGGVAVVARRGGVRRVGRYSPGGNTYVR